jgi:multidrug efflux pump subunit AcrB
MTSVPSSTRHQKEVSSYWFARHSKPIIFLVVVLAILGIYEAFSIPVAVFPATNFPRIIIGVDNGVMPIDQMEVTITSPIEEAVNSVEGLEDVRSTTSRGSAEVDLSFNWSVDMIQKLQEVNSALGRIQGSLPPTARIESHRLDFASFPIVGYSLTSDTVPQTQLWEIATYDLKPVLNRLNGVATVLVQGGQQPEFQIAPDAAKMLRGRVTLQEVLDAVNRTNIIDSPGLITGDHRLYLALVTAQVQTPDQIGDIVIKNENDVSVRIRDIATVAPAAAPSYTVVTANGKPATLVSINRQPDSNTVEVANEVHQKIEDLRSSLPAGVDLKVFYDQSDIVKESIGSVRDAIIIGLFLTGFILWLFLHDLGTAVMSGLVVPIAICITFIALKLLGQSFNMMTLGGLAAAGGLVIDDAIVMVENIVLHRDRGESPLEATSKALRELTIPLIGSTLTPIVVFLPLLLITGVTGTFFRALSVAMSVSLLTSLVLALCWTTNVGAHLIRRSEKPQAHEDSGAITEEERRVRTNLTPPLESGLTDRKDTHRRMAPDEASLKRDWFGSVLNFYERWLGRALAQPAWLAGFCGVLIVISCLCYSRLGTDLLPEMDEGGFVLDYVMPPGSSLEETNRVISHVESIIRATPEVESTSRRTGLQLGLAAVTEPNTGDIAVKLKKSRGRGIDEIIKEIRSKLETQEPVLDVDFTQVLQDMIGDLTGAPQPVAVKLFSPDAALLGTWAPRVAAALGSITVRNRKPVVDVQDGIEDTTSGPAVIFTVNPEAAARSGFTADQLMLAASVVVDGEPAATPVVIADRPYTLRLRFPEANRASLDGIRNTTLVNSVGGTATLGSLAEISEIPGQTEILRENLQRDVEVTARLEGLDLGSGVAAAKKAVKDLNLPSSIRVEYGGTYQEQQKSFRDLVVVLSLALVLIFIVLLFEFRSFSAPVAILASAILSTSGVFLALLITGTTFNISSFMGLIMVVGIVAKNGILLLDSNQKFQALGTSPEEALVQAGRRRLRPIVMTALAAVAGMIPLTLAWGTGSQMLQPLAIAVIGGILISMVLSLIITPAILAYLTRKKSAHHASSGWFAKQESLPNGEAPRKAMIGSA